MSGNKSCFLVTGLLGRDSRKDYTYTGHDRGSACIEYIGLRVYIVKAVTYRHADVKGRGGIILLILDLATRWG
jgi:hypothetical protein